jgi:FkbM family methyltransferase
MFISRAKNLLKYVVDSEFRRSLVPFDPFAKISYSNDGEDLFLGRIFDNHIIGFYVDIGAHHPKRFSNTYRFYQRGWRGLNVDATPGSMEAFVQTRPRDINVEMGVSDKEEELTFYCFNDGALNGFSKDLSDLRASYPDYKIIKQIPVKTVRMETLLDMYLPVDQEINFCSIDVEGLDYQVLRSNNWNKYRPQILLIEVLDLALSDVNDNEIVIFLNSVGYELYGKGVNTLYFKRKDFVF